MAIKCRIKQGYTGQLWRISVEDADGVVQTLDVNYTCRLVIPSTGVDRNITDKNGDSTAFLVQLSPTETGNLAIGFVEVAVIIENDTFTPEALKDIKEFELEVVAPLVAP